MRIKIILLGLLLLPVSVFAEQAQVGLASWYGSGDPAEGLNLFTANGEWFDPTDITCASWDYPFDTLLKVSNLNNGKEVLVRVNDRGPAKWLSARKVDLSKAAFSKIADPEEGLTVVEIVPAVTLTPEEKTKAKENTYIILEDAKEVVRQELTLALRQAVEESLMSK